MENIRPSWKSQRKKRYRAGNGSACEWELVRVPRHTHWSAWFPASHLTVIKLLWWALTPGKASVQTKWASLAFFLSLFQLPPFASLPHWVLLLLHLDWLPRKGPKRKASLLTRTRKYLITAIHQPFPLFLARGAAPERVAPFCWDVTSRRLEVNALQAKPIIPLRPHPGTEARAMEKSISQQKAPSHAHTPQPRSNGSGGRLEAGGRADGRGVAWGNQAAGDANTTDVLTLS